MFDGIKRNDLCADSRTQWENCVRVFAKEFVVLQHKTFVNTVQLYLDVHSANIFCHRHPSLTAGKIWSFKQAFEQTGAS